TGQGLKALRINKGWSVAKLAQALKTTPGSIYRWEKNIEVLKLTPSCKKALTRLLK
ncbi:XRE family transcriptional regulator, partial [bacterium]|nr:XRE family transcriptional regulator [bacterium]